MRNYLLLSITLFLFLFVSNRPTGAVIWSNQVIDSAGDVGQYSSIVYDYFADTLTRYPSIAYYDTTQGNVKYAFYDGAVWTVETVDSAGDVGRHVSLYSEGGDPYVSYYDATNGDLKTAVRLRLGGWVVETVDSAGNVGEWSSVAWDRYARPGIAYFDRTNWSLKYAAKDSGVWQIETVDTGGVGPYCSLVYTPDNEPYISYWDAHNGDLKFAWHDGVTWHTETVDASAATTGLYSSLVLDANDLPHIAYWDRTSKDLKYAYHDGVGWNIEVVDSSGNVGRHCSLDIDRLGRSFISYYYEWGAAINTMHDLRVAQRDFSGTWTVTQAHTEGHTGTYSSVVADPTGILHISFYNSLTGDLVYLRSDPTGTAHLFLADRGTTWQGAKFEGPYDYEPIATRLSPAGDVNGDGFGDFMTSSWSAFPNGTNSGEAHLVYGKGEPSPLAGDYSLSNLGGSLDGATFRGTEAYEGAGTSISPAGDVNNDGLDDILIGTQTSYPSAIPGVLIYRRGTTYLIYGQSGGSQLSGAIELLTVGTTTAGAVFTGANDEDGAGGYVATAGDVNGDGLDDILIGAINADPNANDMAGVSYLIYGQSGGSLLSGTIDLANVGGSVAGASFNGIDPYDFSGQVGRGGDVNGDGLADLVIGAYGGDPNGIVGAGEAYLIYGRRFDSSPLSGSYNLSDVGGSLAGATLNGYHQDKRTIVAHVGGDINGDGLEDLLLAAFLAPSRYGLDGPGAVYLVYGKTGPATLSGTVELSDLGATVDGATFEGYGGSTQVGKFLAGVGDYNGDGVDDFCANSAIGHAYVIFGRSGATSYSGHHSLEQIGTGLAGLMFDGDTLYSDFGKSVGAAGDVNGDGYADLLAGSFNGSGMPGYMYLVYGMPWFHLYQFTHGTFRETAPHLSAKYPSVATRIHFGAVTDPDIFFAINGPSQQYYYFDDTFGEAYWLTPTTLTQNAGYGNLTDLWTDAVARVPDFLVSWDPDGDDNDEIWAILGSDYYVFDWTLQQFGAAQPLSNIGAGSVAIDAATKFDNGSGIEQFVLVDGTELFSYNPTIFPGGATFAISSLTNDGSSFSPDFILFSDDDLDGTDTLYLFDSNTDAVWFLSQGQFQKHDVPLSGLWSTIGQIPTDSTRGDFFLSFKHSTGSDPPQIYAIVHQ